jgi:hypothetical protein
MGLRKTALLLILVVLSVGSGMEIGWAWRPLDKYSAAAPSTQPTNTGGPRPWIDQLGLNPDQQKQIEKIWNDTQQQMQKIGQQHRDLERQREKQVLDILDQEQQITYAKIEAQSHAGHADLDKQRESLIAAANARSRALLDPSQQEQWDILSKEIRHRRGPMGSMGSATQHSTTQPSGQPLADGEEHHN